MIITEEKDIDKLNKYIDAIDALAERMELTNIEMIYALEQLKFETQVRVMGIDNEDRE